MAYKNRQNLQGDQLFIYQNSHVENNERWSVSYKLNGYKRVFKSLGIVSESDARKVALREFVNAEQTLEEFGEAALLGKNRIKDALSWFKQEGQAAANLKDSRYEKIIGHWNTHLTEFFGKQTLIDKRLQTRMREYVEYRRRVIDKRTGKKLRAAASTIRLEIASAQRVLNLAREHAGIGKDCGSLSLKIDKKTLRQNKSKSTTFTHEEIEKIKTLFDEDAEVFETKISDTGNHRAAKAQLFYLRRLEFFFAISVATGNRAAETKQIRHGDFARDFQSLRIRNSKTEHGTNRQAFVDNTIWNIEDAYQKFLNYSHTKKKNERVFQNHFATRGQDNMKAIGASLARFLKRHRMLYEKTHRKRRRDFYATRHYFITKQIDDNVKSWDLARACGTSVHHLEKTYYEDNADVLVAKIADQKSQGKRQNFKIVDGGKK